MKGYQMFRDPVHGFIKVPTQFMPLVDTSAFQRLRRLGQLGASYITYHGGEHSRFGHSLGVFHLFLRLASHFREIGQPLNDEEETVGACAALLHDIGHGPLSHALEGLVAGEQKHEMWSIAVIQQDAEVKQALQGIDSRLPEQVIEVLAGRSSLKKVNQLISSQIDADRMDYLLRDSMMTGAMYGTYDLDRLIEVLHFHDDRMMVEKKGLPTAEMYLLARYNMYWQVYFHKTTRGMENLLKTVWKRAVQLYREEKLKAGVDFHRRLAPFFKGEPNVADFLAVDDHDIWAALKDWSRHGDPILRDLSLRCLNRRLLKPIDYPREPDPNATIRAAELIRRCGYDPDYYMMYDRTSNVAYDYYIGGEEEERERPSIFVLNRDGRYEEISRVSETIHAIAKERVAAYLYVPEACRHDVHKVYYPD